MSAGIALAPVGPVPCHCGAPIVPALGALIDGECRDWSRWVPGCWEHIERPSSPHPAVPASCPPPVPAVSERVHFAHAAAA